MGSYSPLFNPIKYTSDLQTVTGSVTYTEGVAPNGQPGVKCTFTGSVAVKIPKLTGALFTGDAVLAIYGGSHTGLQSLTFRVYQNFAGNTQKFKQYVFLSSPLNNYREQGSAISLFNNNLSWGVSGTPSNSYSADDVRITLVSNASETAEVWLLGVSLAFTKRKSRICVTFDDGYSSVLSLGAPLMMSKSIPFTLGVIPDAVDNQLNGYMSLSEVRSLISSGNSVVPHYNGDLIGETSPEIFRQYSESVVKWIEKNNLTTPNFEKCYIWPQAKFQNKPFQLDYLKVAHDDGVNVGRGANPLGAASHQNIDSLSVTGRLAMPVIGHGWAGSTALEASNITEIVNRINQISDNGGVDFFIVLHKVVPDSTLDANMSLSIRVSDLTTIVSAIETKISEGKLEAVLMNDLTNSSVNPWSEYF